MTAHHTTISKGSSNRYFERSFLVVFFMLHLLSGTNWMVVLGKLLILTHLNVKLKQILFLSYFDLYNIVLACCMYIDITVYFMLLLCCNYINFDNGIAFQVY